jgi:hypothetical protein
MTEAGLPYEIEPECTHPEGLRSLMARKDSSDAETLKKFIADFVATLPQETAVRLFVDTDRTLGRDTR